MFPFGYLKPHNVSYDIEITADRKIEASTEFFRGIVDTQTETLLLSSDLSCGLGGDCIVLYFSTLGTCGVSTNGRPIRLNVGSEGRNFAAYLFSNPNIVHRREKMLANFWPDAQEKEAKKRLNNTLSSLRLVIEKNTTGDPKSIIYSTHDEVGASLTEEITADAVNLKLSVEKEWEYAAKGLRVLSEGCVDALQSAVRSYHGDYLEDFDAQWIQGCRNDYFTYFIRARILLMRHFIGVENYEEAIEQASKILEWDDSREMVLRDLMRLLVINHQRARALACYESFVRELNAQHGLEPMPVTRKLRDAVVQGLPIDSIEMYSL